MISPEELLDHDCILPYAQRRRTDHAASYSEDQYTRETITELMNRFKESLCSVIQFCCAQGKVVLTPADTWQTPVHR